MKKTLSTVLAGVVAGALLLAGCSGGSGSRPADGDAGLQGPVLLSPDALAGKEVSITPEVPLVIVTGDSDSPEDWAGTVDDASVAAFEPGRVEEGATFAPGFTGLKEGITGATLTTPEGDQIDFTLKVISDNAKVTPSED